MIRDDKLNGNKLSFATVFANNIKRYKHSRTGLSKDKILAG